jgi:hypothetical protein
MSLSPLTGTGLLGGKTGSKVWQGRDKTITEPNVVPKSTFVVSIIIDFPINNDREILKGLRNQLKGFPLAKFGII